MVLTPGTGNKPSLTDKVKVHYHGTLIDGKVFDSSVDRGEPIAFPLNGVIQGWQEGVQLMQVGAKYRFFIPHELGYGSRPAGQIPPYSTLIFDVELLGINVE
jgi:FKBP-type peptidyl-prolyl cis-trans isomerase